MTVWNDYKERNTGLLRLWTLAVVLVLLFSLTVPAYAQTEDNPPEQDTTQETAPAETEPEETQPEETQPEETQPEETQPEETQPEETQPEETQPEETQPEETQPEETQPEETQPEETQPEETVLPENVSITFVYPDRQETVSVTPGSSFSDMYPGIDTGTLTAEKECHTFTGWHISWDGGLTLQEEAYDFHTPVKENIWIYPAFRFGTGTFKAITTPENFGGGWLSESADSLAAAVPLTEEEMRLYGAGAEISVRLELNNLGTGASSEAAALVTSALGEMTLGTYLEANLYKQVGEQAEVPLTRLENTVTVSFQLPQELLPEEGASRAFAVIRVHEGVAEPVSAVYRQETGVLSFSSDGFSTFAVVYTDTQQAPPSVTPDTGDGSFPGLLAAAALLSALALTVLCRKREVM